MRSYYIAMVLAIFVGLISCGCQIKQNNFGKFTEEEVSAMGFAQVDGLPEASGGITLSIMGETITADEVVNTEAMIKGLGALNEFGSYESFERKAREPVSRVIMGKVSDILLYQLARKDSPDNIDDMLVKAVDKEVDKHVANYENNFAKAEAAFKGMGFADWDDFREYKKKLVMTQFYISKQIKKDQPISHSEMVARYNALKKEYFDIKGLLKIRVIEIEAGKLAADEIDSASGETAGQAAVRKGKELSKRAKDGEDFAELAEANSHGIARKVGGLWPDVTVGSLAAPYDELEKAAEMMEPGDVSDVIEAGGYVFVMKLDDKRKASVTPFTEVQDRIEAEIRLIQQRVEYNRVLVEIVEQAEVKDREVFTNYCLRHAFEIINSSK